MLLSPWCSGSPRAQPKVLVLFLVKSGGHKQQGIEIEGTLFFFHVGWVACTWNGILERERKNTLCFSFVRDDHSASTIEIQRCDVNQALCGGENNLIQ